MIGAPVAGYVVYNWHGDLDAIDEYSQRLVTALHSVGVPARYLSGGLDPVLRAGCQAEWILLQYNPFRWGRSGFAPRLIRDVITLRHRHRGMLAIMVHEAWIEMDGPKATALGLWQRLQLRWILSLVDRVMTSTQALAEEIGDGAVHAPVASNISPVDASAAAARERLGIDDRLVVALFGRAHPSRALDYVQAAISALASVHGSHRLMVLNLGADAPAIDVPAGVQVCHSGALAEAELSLHLSAADLMLLPFIDGVSTRRSTLMAALSHGRPVLALHGRNTDPMLVDARDALTLTPVGDRAGFAREAVALSLDPGRLRRMGEAGRRLYAEQFDWPVLARRTADVLGAEVSTPPVGMVRA